MSTNLIKYPNYFSRAFYYSKSLFSLIYHIKNFPSSLVSALKNKEKILTLRNGIKFYVRDLMELWVIKETIIDDSYLIDCHFKNIDPLIIKKIIDIGGALGDFSIFCAKKFKNSEIYLFEPQIKSCHQVEKNMELNLIDNKQIIVSNTAVSNSEYKEFYKKEVSVNNLKNGEMLFSEDCINDEKITIDFTNLNIFLEKLNCEIDILKIDCEGGEYNIIPSIKPTLLKNIKLIVMEWHEFNESQSRYIVIDYLNSNGFNVKVKRSPVHNEIGYLFATRV